MKAQQQKFLKMRYLIQPYTKQAFDSHSLEARNVSFHDVNHKGTVFLRKEMKEIEYRKSSLRSSKDNLQA